MAPLRGWGPRGQRLPAKVPQGHWTTMTFLGALRHDRLTAPWLIDGPINGETFRLYVDQVLIHEGAHIQTGRKILERFAVTEEIQARVRAIRDEKYTLKERIVIA